MILSSTGGVSFCTSNCSSSVKFRFCDIYSYVCVRPIIKLIVITFYSNIFRSETAVSLIDQMYKPNLAYTHKEIDTIFESILNQSAMKLDTIYEDSVSHANFFSI